MKKGILIITPSFPPDIGGMATHLSGLCAYLAAQGDKVFLAACQPIMTKGQGKWFEKTDYGTVIRMPVFGWRRFIYSGRFRFLIETVLLLPPALFFLVFMKRGIRAIHCHNPVAAFTGIVLGLFFSKKVIVSTHNRFIYNPAKLSNWLVRWALLKADAILAISPGSKEELLALGVEPKKIKVYSHWVDDKIFRPLDKLQAREKTGLKRDFTVLYVGRLEKVKGVEVLLAAASVLNHIFFAFIGDGPLADAISEKCKTEGNILFLGKVVNKELPLYLNSVDLLAIPTLIPEAFGIVIIEAFACGLPVIGTNLGRIPEIIDNGGIVLNPPYEANFIKCIKELSEDRNRLNELSRNAAKLAKEKYGRENAGLIQSAYQDLNE